MATKTGYSGVKKPPLSIDEHLVNHLFLPPQLPQGQETGINKIELGLLARLEDAAICLRDLPANPSQEVWQSVCRSLASWRSVTAYGRLDKTVLETELRRLDTRDFMGLYIREQNAGIAIHRQSDEVVFEVFEASPRSKDVLEAKSALQWDFPGAAVAVPYTTCIDHDFLSSLCLFLEQASAESIKDFAAHTTKAGMTIVEDRDTKDPRLISSMFVAVLEANGRLIRPPPLRKRVRDDVLWRNAAVPWRRLPFWLILRVAIQRHLLRSLSIDERDTSQARMEYKVFVCVLLSKLLDVVRFITTPDRLSHMKAKLCRRLAKIDVEMETGCVTAVASYKFYQAHLDDCLERSIRHAGSSLEGRWERFREATTRRILPLAGRADTETLTLSLEAGSLQYIQHALTRFRNTKGYAPRGSKQRQAQLDSTPQSSDILDPYFKLAECEWQLQQDYTLVGKPSVKQPHLDVATSIRQYLGNVGDLYDFSVEQKSNMLLTVMELWMRLDLETCERLPLLREFHPSFSPDILDLLHLPRWSDMIRLRRVQAYLRLRIDQSSSSMTIFDSPREGCFAQRFFDEAPETERFRKRLDAIKRKAAKDRQDKEEEWMEKNATFETLTRQLDRSVCVFLPTVDQPQTRRFAGPQNHDPKCPKCAMDRQLRNLKISLWENPLPADDLMAKVAVFELGGCPELEEYRDVTYFLIVKLGTETLEPSIPPRCSVREYVQLQGFARPSEPSFRLVSTTKSFFYTHYATMSFPVPLSDVLRSNRLKYGYYDETTQSYARRIRRPTFAHLCALRLPTSSALAPLINTFPADKSGPSSYEIIASQISCPTGVNLHEYMAVQSLLSGTSRRWISLLTELGGSNINFSTEATAMIVNHIANQCGRATEEDEVLGSNHVVFQDPPFRDALLKQMAYKLEGIASNWREVFTMETIITLAQRASVLSRESFQFSAGGASNKAFLSSAAILRRAKEVTLNWVLLLREATKQATDLETVRRYQTYTLWAALLCKRTFDGSFSPDALPAFVLCCITLQDHLATSHDFYSTLKSAIIRDTKMMYALKDKIEGAIRDEPYALLQSFNAVWAEGDHFREQVVVYNYMHGLLLVDGTAIGKLPSDYNTSEVLTELFGNQSLLTRLSRMSGMQYTLCVKLDGHEIHVGFIGDQMVIRACKGLKIWELIPRDVFGTRRCFDLPGPLIKDCFYWLELKEGKSLEIRLKHQMWMSKETNWRVTLTTGICTRLRSMGKYRDVLVDPHVRLFYRAARNLEGLEHRHEIVVYQRHYRSTRGKVYDLTHLDLPRLQLSFYKRGVLQCPQYQAVVAADQDIGTWHGLHSKLKDGDYLKVEIDGQGSFGMFKVNDVLRRIECAPEPRLIYQKAVLHAYTSFELADELTGMTGSESALHWLSSGLCQPWYPLGEPQLDVLRALARLTPRREYYPADMRVMKKEEWGTNLTTTVQIDAYTGIVGRIIGKSEALTVFNTRSLDQSVLKPVKKPPPQSAAVQGNDHLNMHEASDLLYTPRDRDSSGKTEYLSVREISSLLRNEPSTLRTNRSLGISLSQSPLILGYNEKVDKADKASISDRLSYDMKREWGTLVKANMDLARTIATFALFKELATIKLPPFTKYHHFRINQYPDEKYLCQLAKPARIPAPYDEREDIPNVRGKVRRQLEQRKARHEQMSEEGCEALAKHLLSAWPCAEPKLHQASEWDGSLLDTGKAYADEPILQPRLTLPADLEERKLIHRTSIVPLIDDLTSTGALPSKSANEGWPRSRVLPTSPVRRKGALSANGDGSWALGTPLWAEAAQTSASIQELSSVVEPYMNSTSRIKQTYGKDLKQSLHAFRAISSKSNIQGHNYPLACTSQEALTDYLKIHLRRVVSSLSCPGTAEKAQWLKEGGLFPILTPITLLEQLRSTNTKRSQDSFSAIVDFGMIITRVQKQMRLNDLATKHDQTRYNEEAENVGHQNWRPQQYPDWLLLEIEADILIRPTQVDVAMATISPPSESNSVLQMNMGQGKTSVVIPMVAAVIANGRSLARIIVPKALLQQNAQLIHARLGGILGREICHVPFSRKTPTDPTTLKAYTNIHRHILQHGGVLMCLPEHNMSFMLSGIQKLLDENVPEAQQMIRTWRTMSGISRDVVDESDYTLATRTQLIYPSGGLTAVHGHPHRWIVAELLLAQVHSHLRGLKKKYPRSIEVVSRQGAFPFVYFLRPDVEDKLLSLLTDDIFSGRTEMLPIASGFSIKDRVVIRDFISNTKILPSTLKRLQDLSPDKIHIRQTVYLLRGLLVNRILLSCMKKRWNVQYGLHPTREPIAVPYTAKGVPSDSSEWGHPDVSILFTCLSFYYQGISMSHLKQALQHLLKSDDPASEYDSWTSSWSFPDSLRNWTSINIDDEGQLHDVWVAVRLRVVVINYFLNNFVFPLYAKQFKVKIQASGWDISLLGCDTRVKEGPKSLTTGFSGTNDTKNMLPLTIQQQDLPGLSHTNAEVLTYLLHQRNRTYAAMTTRDGSRLREEQFLQLLKSQNIQVLIDAGAQILEMSNFDLAKKWLEIDDRPEGAQSQAALFFDALGKPWILPRSSMTLTPLLASQFADNLDQCLIYLDEAHTRGTDLKLPPYAHGALTLGLGQTKDHTVQAAMRLRQLGTTQRVTFFAPPEVHQSIFDLTKKQDSDKIDSRDVVTWLLDNTCESIEALQPLYYSQGIDFCRRMQAAAGFPDFLSNAKQRESYVASIRQDEQQTLEQLYGPRTKAKKAAALKKATDPLISEYLKELEARRKGEVEMQVESVRQVRKVNQYPVHNWPGIHKDLLVFARTGHLPAQSLSCSSLWSVLSRTGLGRKFRVCHDAVETNLFLSVEFERTVKMATEKLNDNFIRPVNWILWSDISSTGVVIIPEEAEALFPVVRNTNPANTVLMTYAAPVTRRMLHFNNLDYYTIPALPKGWRAPDDLKVQLGMLAGRLYFEWDEYPYLAKVNGVEGANESHQSNGHAHSQPSTKLFIPSPLTFMQEWLAVRRRGQDVANTPMGFITQGKPLSGDHPFFRQDDDTEERAALRGTTASRIVAGKEKE
ncbi:hypothetical protein GE09DRAFT_1197755 [Coniochaeta sp. 2T2.1]|nr:hypothetical protein GE09DRAFT_1197755 [Coniochaeta sp. 2T2.1]